MPRHRWSEEDIPSLAGRTAVVTGASSGIGFETARALAAAGAAVILACRDPTRGRRALRRIRASHPEASVRVEELDLADLASVRSFADRQRDHLQRLDILINNAGLMGGPFRRTVDGFERQIATNFLGHFALTGALLPLLLAAPAARIVTLTSITARSGRLTRTITLDEFRTPRMYIAQLTYSNSKQADLLFARELARRATAKHLSLISVAAHPGISATNLMTQRPWTILQLLRAPAVIVLAPLLLQSARAGAGPSLYAATAPGLSGGELIGPSGRGQIRGRPTPVALFPTGRDEATARRLWEIGVEATGADYRGL